MNDELYLVYVKYYSTNPDGTYDYDFYFSKHPENVWGLDWDCYNPSICEDLTPDGNLCDKIERKNIKYKLATAEDSSCYSMEYVIEGDIALSWIDIEGMDVYPEEGRMTLHFGDCEDKVKEIIGS